MTKRVESSDGVSNYATPDDVGTNKAMTKVEEVVNINNKADTSDDKVKGSSLISQTANILQSIPMAPMQLASCEEGFMTKEIEENLNKSSDQERREEETVDTETKPNQSP